MAYCRWGEGSDAYVYRNGTDFVCSKCTIGSLDDDFPHHIEKSELGMANHLREHQEAGHRIPDSAILRLMEEDTESMQKRSAKGESRPPRAQDWYVVGPNFVPADHLITSICVERRGVHDHVRVWNRGALAGEIVLQGGDGMALASLLRLARKEE